jgi:hypothetical protein
LPNDRFIFRRTISSCTEAGCILFVQVAFCGRWPRAGAVAPVSNTVALAANVSQTFARQGGNDFYGNGGLKISFEVVESQWPNRPG